MEVYSPAAEWLERANQLAITVRLLPNTVHDVNNALQVITGSAELLDLAGGADEDVRRRGLAIRTQAGRATGFLNDLMGFTRDTSDRAQRLSLRAVAERGLALRRYSMTKMGIKTTLDGDAMALANPRSVLQILLNVLINAEEALAGRPGGRIGVGITEANEQLRLTITDNGPGLSAEAEQRLFRPTQGTTERRGCLGIGLIVSKGLAQRQGGALSFAPAPDGGCAFTLTLPIAPPEA